MFISKIVAGALLLNTGRQRPYTPPLEGGVGQRSAAGSAIACLCTFWRRILKRPAAAARFLTDFL